MAVGTTAAILGAAAIGGIASIASGVIGANAANNAATTQADAADRALEIQNDQYNRSLEIQREQFDRALAAQQDQFDRTMGFQQDVYNEGVERGTPWIDAGRTALEAYMGELGLSDAAKNGTFQSGFQSTPGYQFQVEEGEKGVVNNLAALGMKNSGAALKALTRFRQGLADQTYQTYLDRVGGVAQDGQNQVNATNNFAAGVAGGMGALGANFANNQANTRMNYAGNVSALGMNYANNAGNIIQDRGDARASGYVGTANAWGNALGNMSNIFGNALGYASNGFGSWGTQRYSNPNADGSAVLVPGYQFGV